MGDAYSYSCDILLQLQLWHDGWIQVLHFSFRTHIYILSYGTYMKTAQRRWRKGTKRRSYLVVQQLTYLKAHKRNRVDVDISLLRMRKNYALSDMGM